MAGYSGTPLLKKLGIKAGYAVRFYDAPDDYQDNLGPMPEGAHILETNDPESLDFIHVFCQFQARLEELLPQTKPLLKKSGMLWVSWPKGKSGLETDLKREPVRDYLLANGLVDVKVAAVDEIWSGLKFVYRLKDRGE